VVGIITQRLARALCERCKRAYTAPPQLLQAHGASLAAGNGPVTFYRPEGCEFCNGIGYRGRTGVFEVMILDDAIRGLVTKGAPAGAIKAEAKRAGMRSLAQDGLEKALRGVTSPEEVLDVVGFED
jgi:general secretion pathway protein E